MNIVIVDKKGIEIYVKGGTLMLNDRRLPLTMCDLLLIGHSVQLSSGTLCALSASGTALLCHRQNDMALTLPLSHARSERKMLQYGVLSKRLSIAKWLLGKKIDAHARDLAPFIAIDAKAWRRKCNVADDIPTLLGIEGAFSRLYFKHYFAQFPPGACKGKRSKRPPEDPVNAMLSYLYTLAYHQLTVQLHAHGYEPLIGFLHEPFREHCALSSDLLEALRPRINRFVLQLFVEGSLAKEDFYKKKGVFMRTETRKRLYPQCKTLLCALGEDAEKQIRALKEVMLEAAAHH